MGVLLFEVVAHAALSVVVDHSVKSSFNFCFPLRMLASRSLYLFGALHGEHG
jgi:hypothetical protein